MTSTLLTVVVASLSSLGYLDPSASLDSVPLEPAHTTAPPETDWLLDSASFDTQIYRNERGDEIILTNGLIRRTWRVTPNLACIALDDLMSDRSLLRAVRPEARLVIDGEVLHVGGLTGQPNHAYLRDSWVDDLANDPASMQFAGYEVLEIEPRFEWKRVRHHAPDVAWPPPGVHLRFDFAHDGLRASVHYEMYDGIPAMSKWITVHNDSDTTIELDRFTCEILAVVEHSNPVEHREGVPLPPPDSIHCETDYAFGGFNHEHATRFSVHWEPDPQFHTQVNWAKQMPCLLEVEPSRGPDQLIGAGETFESFRAFELVYDSTERERRGLALRRFYRTVAPWVTENPLILHVVSTDPEVVKNAIDQAATCGFEMVSLSFGSGLNMEDSSDANIARFKRLNDYAMTRGIHLGGYSLLSSRRIGEGNDVVSPPGEKPTHGNCPALTSEWGQSYFERLYHFFDTTGFLQFTHDGSYPGDFDTTARPPLQRGLDDSQWAQWKVITEFYTWLRGRGAYLRVPDYYFLMGANECGMGYREVNWSLPRAQQVIHTRQNIYDGTWVKTPSMGWMFVPLTQYHGGGAAATIEPLDEHIDHYERMLMSNLGLGVQAVYRGHRLYDTPRVREMVTNCVTWFKQYRDILESDVIHGRRADGRDLDWMLHVNPRLDTPGMLVVYNPLDRDVTREIRVNLYYTGLTERAMIHPHDLAGTGVDIAANGRIDLEVTVPAGGMSWYVIRPW